MSSNFITYPKIGDSNLPVIKNLTFSISGFKQESYGKIHGASLSRVLNNFNKFSNRLRSHSPQSSIVVAWHRYKFNESEFWEALKYFTGRDIGFVPSVAYFNDLMEMLDFVQANLPDTRQVLAGEDLFLDYLRERMSDAAATSKNYKCPAWDYIVVDEFGRLLLCCGVTGADENGVLGGLTTMRLSEIWDSKEGNPLCEKCVSLGIAKFLYSSDGMKMPYPPGGAFYMAKRRLWRIYGSICRRLSLRS